MPEHDLHFIILWNSKNLGSLCDHGKKRKLNTGTNNEGWKGLSLPVYKWDRKNIAWKITFQGSHFRQITLERGGKNSLKFAKDRV